MAGLEPVLAEELQTLGATEIYPGKRAVFFEGDLELLYRANYCLRTALRILVPIRECKARNEDDLYRQISAIDWSQYLGPNDTLAVDAVTNSEVFRHSKYVALKTKDAIVDQFRRLTGVRPDVDVTNPHLRINVHVGHTEVTVALDSSGDSLHKRGYRLDSVEAPINEVLAAGMILLSGWRGEVPFLDPMCGSGTLAIEAALLAHGIPPQQLRQQFGFMRWKNFDRALWATVRQEAPGPAPEVAPLIFASDKDFQAVKIANLNAIAAGLEGKVKIERARFETLTPPPAPGLLMMNPPYDQRLELQFIEDFYGAIGDRLKQCYAGYQAWIISAHLDALKNIGLRASRRFPLFNGNLECKLLKFDLYAGSKKKPVEE